MAIFNGGNRTSGIVVCVEDKRYRLKGLESGEVALYTDEGDSLVLKRDNTIEINTKKFIVNAQDSIELSTKETVINTEKFRVTNGSDDITALMTNWMSEVIAATTSTMLGPMKLFGSGFPALKSKLEKFKK